MELEGNISEFMEHHGECSMQDIVDHFGTPEKYAEEYLAANECDERLQQTKRSKHLSLFIVASILVVVLIIGVTAVTLYKEHSHTLGYYHEYILSEK